MKANNEVIEKLRKVLTLAEKGATQGEMEAAMARAKEIAIRHGIDLASVDINAGDDATTEKIEIERDDSLRTKSSFERRYHTYIYDILRKVFEVYVLPTRYNHGGRTKVAAIHIIGEVTDVAIAKEIFKWLEDMFTKSFNVGVRNGLWQNDAASQNGFYYGLWQGILETNKRAQAGLSKQEAQCYALVVRNKEALVQERAKQEFPHVRMKKARMVNANPIAHRAGYEKGRTVRLGNQVGTGNGRREIR